MKKNKNMWFNAFAIDRSLMIPKKRKIVKIIKLFISMALIGVFVFLSTRETQISEHNFYIDKSGSISNSLENKSSNPELKLVAVRGETSFLNLSAGCVSETEWLLPKTGEPTLNSKTSVEKKYLISPQWTSIPPARGDYSANTTEPPQRILVVNPNSPSKNGLTYSDALSLLYEGNYVIWYNPALMESDLSTYNQMSNYIVDKILDETKGGPKYYLAPLPEYRIKELPRSIYFTKLNHTQSCVKFNQKVFDNFYTQEK